MITVHHRFLNHQINPGTETLIIGTFNPETTDNPAEFFYGRSRNYLWRLLSTAFGVNDLKGASRQEKIEFIKKFKIDLIDLIEEIKVDEGEEVNYYDGYIDNKVTRWCNVIAVMDNLQELKRVCFTRKTFSDIPHIKEQLDHIKQHCTNRGITYTALTTPARYYSENKQTVWTNFLLNGSR